MGLFEVPFFSDKPIWVVAPKIAELPQAGDLFKIIQVQDDASTVELAYLSEFRYGCGQLYFNHQASYIYSWFMLVLYTHHLYCWLHIYPHISIIHWLNPLFFGWLYSKMIGLIRIMVGQAAMNFCRLSISILICGLTHNLSWLNLHV
jgi:hypothetical protein